MINYFLGMIIGAVIAYLTVSHWKNIKIETLERKIEVLVKYGGK